MNTIFTKLFYIHLIHLVVIGSFLLYVGIVKTNMPSFMYTVLFITSILIVIAHGYLAISLYNKPKSYLWVNLFHIFIVAPVLLMIGLNGVKTPRYYFQLILMLGFAAIGYHGYYLVKELVE